ncbi:uncharacterized protein LOC110853496 [Folsomia candida]|uniref:Uncharacterized protein n=1 Tax=Folsomia candida TaxID=158441 RepID=A0A226E2S2_FOLCA|nr:uncharacterized protein LOC110853496 [Folsomia candida]OXA51277.1 hypothetical protein Fcan01_14231 [Folsomia candida]
MPTPTEQNFFLTAFKILDKHQGTQWLRKYNELLQYSPNGRINWTEIPGLLISGGPIGYTGAIKRICELLIATKQQSPRDTRLKGQYNTLVRLAKEVYQSRRSHQGDVQRQKGLFTYILFKLSICTCIQDDDTLKHVAAKKVWKDAWLMLLEEM